MMYSEHPLMSLCDWQLEEAAQEVADEVTRPRPVGEETVQDIQVMLKSDAHPSSIRSLKVSIASHCSHLLYTLLMLGDRSVFVSVAVGAGVASREDSRHNHILHGSEGQSYQSVSSVPWLQVCHQ